MNDNAFIQLAIGKVARNQKELAGLLGVSPTQISKWKRGEYMSLDMEKKLRSLLEIDEIDPQLIVLTGSVKNAQKWEKLICYLADIACEESETDYITYPLCEEKESLCVRILELLEKIGLPVPKEFPEELIIADLDNHTCDIEDGICKGCIFYENIEENEYTSTIYDIFVALTNVYGFYLAFIQDISHDTDDKFSADLLDIDGMIEYELLSLAATKIEFRNEKSSKFVQFRRETEQMFEEYINKLKKLAFRHNLPLKAELLDLVYSSSDDLCCDVERESLGFNQRNLHPDIYMNELLTGMRIIHQVLPVIMEKLGIDDIELDTASLKIDHARHKNTDDKND